MYDYNSSKVLCSHEITSQSQTTLLEHFCHTALAQLSTYIGIIDLVLLDVKGKDAKNP